MTQENDPLQGMQRLGLDTAPFIYFIEQNPTFIDRARAVFRRSLLLDSENVLLIPVTPAVAERAAELHATYQLRTPDAIQIAAALQTQCDAFLTNDRRLRRVNEIRVIVFDNLADRAPQSEA